MEIIVALKEPLWRRCLRYGLWIVIFAGVAVGLYLAAAIGRDLYAQNQQVAQIETAEIFLPQKALAEALELEHRAPSDSHRALLARVAFEAGNYNLAQKTLEQLSDQKSVALLALRAATAAKLSATDFESIAGQLQKAAPATDSERYWGAWGCLASECPQLRTTATRFLAHLDSPSYKNRAAFLRLQIALLDNELDEARARTKALFGKPLPPSEAVGLMIIAQWLDLPEARAYRAMLEKRAAKDSFLAAVLESIK
jgi:hypothetical protein